MANFPRSNEPGDVSDRQRPDPDILALVPLQFVFLDAIFNKDLAHQLESLAQQKSLPALLAMFEAAQNTKVALKSNANAQLSLENMLLNFCEAT